MTKPNLFTLIAAGLLLLTGALLLALTEHELIASNLLTGGVLLLVPNRIGAAAVKLALVCALAFFAMTSSACSPSTAAATCGAYETVVEPARAMCHRACDAIPSECPWRGSAGGELAVDETESDG
jgi:hypothetical protein